MVTHILVYFKLCNTGERHTQCAKGKVFLLGWCCCLYHSHLSHKPEPGTRGFGCWGQVIAPVMDMYHQTGHMGQPFQPSQGLFADSATLTLVMYCMKNCVPVCNKEKKII